MADAAYLAGILDGEGSIILYARRDAIAMRVSVSNTYKPVLEWIAGVTGIGVVLAGRRGNAVNKQGWQWQCNAEAAESLLCQVHQHLRIKAIQADLAIHFQERLRIPILKYNRSWQTEWRFRMKSLNARGPQSPVISLTASACG